MQRVRSANGVPFESGSGCRPCNHNGPMVIGLRIELKILRFSEKPVRPALVMGSHSQVTRTPPGNVVYADACTASFVDASHARSPAIDTTTRFEVAGLSEVATSIREPGEE